MKVGYDSNSSQNIQGTGTYASNLINNMKIIDPELDLIGLDYQEFYENMGLKDRIKKLIMRKKAKASGDPYWEWNKVPEIGKEKGIEIYHSMGGCVPKSADFETIQTILDLAYYYYPDYLTPPTINFFKKWYKESAQSADVLIAISESTKKDIIKYWDIPEEKIHVIHLGVSDKYFEKKPEDEIIQTKKKYLIPGNYFLFVGELNYRKNINTLIKGFKIFQKENKGCKLVLAGRLQEGAYGNTINTLIKNNGLENEILFPGRVTMDELFCLYQGATAFVFPSLYEGFGLPVLEAMASETPVISSNTSSIPEVAGDAAILVDPLDEKAIAEAMLRIHDDSNLSNSLIQKGRARAEQFTWKKTAEKTLDLYKKTI
ncbi:MAG: glycosyltransferase family 4 protein [Candidatus Heimdallarchaeota archaeon]|nr:glycosyltransferase family 4 protein [Candidatus Heimdallarchaeota archaeon]